MRKAFYLLFLSMFISSGLSGFGLQEQVHRSLKGLEPESYRYSEAERCLNCKQESNDIMTRAVGVDISSGKPVLQNCGWLGSVHSKSQSHGDRVDTACAWCHAPTAKGATRDKEAATAIEKGTWQGVTCGACHPGPLRRELRKSLLSNFIPGSDPAKPESYIFVDKSDGRQFNAQCRYCHHQSHDLLIEAKRKMFDAGGLRCIDCHMAGYAGGGVQAVERFHNFKVADNLPYSCSGRYGAGITCHAAKTKEWMESKLPLIKSPRKDW